MAGSIFVRKEEEKLQIEAIKKSIRIFFEGDVDYNQRLNFIDYDFSKDEDILKILNAFDNKYTINDLTNLWKDTMITAYNKENKLIFIYDGLEKFTLERKKTLDNYPEEFKIGFPIELWKSKCEEIQSKSIVSLPLALKDSLVDIICTKSGYTVIRLMFNEFNWTEEGAMDRLVKIIGNTEKGNSIVL